MTQREWDRIVGWGKVQAPAKKKLKFKFTNHQATYDRYPGKKPGEE